MKRVIITTVMLLAAVCFIVFHYHKVSELDKFAEESYNQIISAYERDDFVEISARLEKLKAAWDDTQTWAGMTVDTDQIEEIEISLLQSISYAKIQAKEDFIGEFILFNQHIKHLPYYEKITLESLL